MQASVRGFPWHRVDIHFGRRALLLAVLLAYGVVGWQQVIHTVVYGSPGSLAGSLQHWLRDSMFALPLAAMAVWLGRQMAVRLGCDPDHRAPLLPCAVLTAVPFVLLLTPFAVLYADLTHQHSSGLASFAALHPLIGTALHGLRDAFVGLAVAVPLAALGLRLLGGNAPATPSLAQPRSLAQGQGGRARPSLSVLGVILPLLALAAMLPEAGVAAQGQTRTYYIAADEVEWNYAPSELNQITGRPFLKSARTWVERGDDRIGGLYRKALYHEYTDASFSTLKPRTAQWEHLGTLGPPIHAAVGDTIQVVFKNNTEHPFSVHAHGVLYTKANEGALYNDGTNDGDKADDAVAPGATYTYTWQVPERAGPGPSDPSSVLWMYHSHVGEVTDTNTGLIGPLIITRRDAARPDGRPADVDREFVTLFNVYDENLSIYLDHNIRTYAGRPNRVKKDDEEFKESNLKHTINGYLFGTLPGLTMRQGDRVRWYTFGLGSEEGIHTPHWHGLAGLWHGMRMDGLDLMPMSMKVLACDLTPRVK
jgi:hypothetical protein